MEATLENRKKATQNLQEMLSREKTKLRRVEP
jgi:hypothetical protein